MSGTGSVHGTAGVIVSGRSCAPRLLDAVRRDAWILVLPHAQHQPTLFTQQTVTAAIPLPIGVDFVAPPLGVGLRRCAVIRAAVPEASVDLDGEPRPAEEDVWPTWHSADVDPESEPSSVQFGAQRKLWPRPRCCETGHECRNLRAGRRRAGSRGHS